MIRMLAVERICPKCGHGVFATVEMETDEHKSGGWARCKACGHKFEITVRGRELQK